ncbi:MAG: electron transfer flavoprotein-ubiquinone oxidoreductase [Acidobacteria bacterium]|nr:electron transfer flavoprotein-ubiquinone oxidoreductase [Acidobacteriota bacterium]
MPGRETLDVDVLIVGGGPAGLSAALQLAKLQRERGGPPLRVAVLEKGRTPGAHSLSGAVLDPSALRQLLPDGVERGAPLGVPVVEDRLYVLTAERAWRVPFTPPPLANRGHVIVSLGELVRWLAREVEAAGVDLFAGFAAAAPSIEDGRVTGVRLVDRGLDRDGHPAAAFEPGADIRARVTILCDGVRGHLTKIVTRTFGLDAGRQPQLYALGIKERWEVPPDRLLAGTVIHTVGAPLGAMQFGGGFIYGGPSGQLSVGLVSGLDYDDPLFDPFLAFQRFKQHPFVARLLEGGRMRQYGAKAIPEGGWWTVPRLYMDGAVIAGDAGAFVNSLRLKGIHLAMRTGMLAAEAAFEAVRADDTSAARLHRYQDLVDGSDVRRELYPVRNVHQAFERGLLAGAAFGALSTITGGGWFRDPLPSRAGHARMRTLESFGDAARRPAAPDAFIDRTRTFDRLTSVHHSGTRHREGQPAHLIVHDTEICRTRCVAEFGNPCTRFCPASVYEMVEDGQGGRRLHLNPSNCVHCKACDIMDPYQIIDWVAPEGGDGPNYEGM